METKKLGITDLLITRVGFGAWAIGGAGWSFGWGVQDDNKSIGAIHHALDSGINWIDTAAVYGLGHSEEIVAKALSGISKRPYVFTKCALPWNDKNEIIGSLKAESVKRECEASLRRLKTDVIDLYQIHWPDPETELEEGWSAMSDLQKEGKVRFIGVSNFNVEQIKRAEKIAPVSSLQPPYSMLRPKIEKEILPYCLKQNIGVISYSPMLSGMLTGGMTKERAENLPPDDWRSGKPEFTEPKLSKNLALVEKLREIGRRHNLTPAVVAIAWVLNNEAVTGAIAGARSIEQVNGFISAGDFRLSEQEYIEINEYISKNI
jgi:aryl-alcohol dehydrogenase-like predicted oxidoreductase